MSLHESRPKQTLSPLLIINGGATHTSAIYHQGSEKARRSIVKRGTNYNVLGPQGMKQELNKLVRSLRLRQRDRIKVLAGFSGAGRPHTAKEIRRIFAALGFTAANTRIVSDAALLVESLGYNEILLISGTGSICMTRDQSRIRSRIVRSGGWGHLVGDEGSGYEMGRRAIIAALRAHDGRDSSTTLSAEIMRMLGVRSMDALVHRLYNEPIGKDRIAALCPAVFKAAKNGDRAAKRIISESGVELAEMIACLCRRQKLTNARIVLSGGVFRDTHVALLQRAMKEPLRKAKLRITFKNIAHEDPTILTLKAILGGVE